jgi:hypothetical protein
VHDAVAPVYPGAGLARACQTFCSARYIGVSQLGPPSALLDLLELLTYLSIVSRTFRPSLQTFRCLQTKSVHYPFSGRPRLHLARGRSSAPVPLGGPPEREPGADVVGRYHRRVPGNALVAPRSLPEPLVGSIRREKGLNENLTVITAQLHIPRLLGADH